MRISFTELRLRVGNVLLLALIAATAFSLLGGFAWWLDLFSHFHLQYTLLALIALVIVLGRDGEHYRPMGIAVAVALSNFMLLSPALDASALDDPPDDEGLERVSLFIANLNRGNRDFEPLIDALRLRNPDVVGLVEFGGDWSAHLTLVLTEQAYPHRLLIPRGDNFGLALYSKLPFEGIERTDARTAFPTIYADFERGFKLVLLHPPPPITGFWSDARDALIYEASEVEGERVILAGDFNATVWSLPMRELFEEGWAHGREGRGLQTTWPDMGFIARLFSVGIDHVLTRGAPILSHEVGGSIGSDHLPLIVEVGLPPMKQIKAERKAKAKAKARAKE